METDGRREQNDDVGNDVIGIIAGSVAAFILTVAIVACLLICCCAKRKRDCTMKSGLYIGCSSNT